mgnify:CR=1 FL=1
MATGQYRKQNLLPSDLDVTTVKAAAAPTTAYTDYVTADFDCRGFREVDFFVDVVAKESMTKLTVRLESGQALDTTTVEYAAYLVEDVDVATGISETNEYQVELDRPTLDNNVVYKVTVPVEGRYVRLALKADNASGSPSVAVYAQRRV